MRKLSCEQIEYNLTPELEEKIKEELCKRGFCFGPEHKLELVARSWDEYVEYVRDLLDDICPCLFKQHLMYYFDEEKFAEDMLNDTVYYVKIDGEEYYVRLV